MMADQNPDQGSLNCFMCQTRDRTEWCVLDDAELELLNKGRVTKEYLPGEVIFHEGDSCRGVFCLETGMVGVRKTDADGNSVLLYLVTPGDTLGYRAMLAGEDYRASAEALEPTRICVINVPTVRSLLAHNPALGLRYLKRVSMSLGNAEEKILHNATLSVRARFAHLLLVLIDKYGEKSTNGPTEFELPLSRHDLASMIGTTPESMSRTIKKMESDGVARFTGRTVHIPEIETLVQEFEPDHFV
jgi:CRP/FNR family transcriptional regulator|tara:strand:- start:1866 stop:2600 length:735 start_codon:yes stop_codon:yes gene_type:complete